jgi:hypothetical protein
MRTYPASYSALPSISSKASLDEGRSPSQCGRRGTNLSALAIYCHISDSHGESPQTEQKKNTAARSKSRPVADARSARISGSLPTQRNCSSASRGFTILAIFETGRRSKSSRPTLIQTTERYLGVEQDLTSAPCAHLGIRGEVGMCSAKA